MARRGSTLAHYLAAVALAALATGLNLALSGPLSGPTLMWPVTAITLAALHGGLGAGYFAAALSVIAHHYLVQGLHPAGTTRTSDLYRLIILAAVGALMAVVAGSLREALRRAKAEKVRAEIAEGQAKRIGDLQERLVAVVSHDLKNPLGATISGVDLLLKNGEVSERQRAILTRTRSSAARMERLIRDLLDFTRARRAFEIPTRSEPSNMQEIVERAILDLLAANPGADIHVTAEGEQTGVWDPARIEQVVFNLVSNAIEHGPPPGSVRIRSRGAGSKVVLEVQNEGQPIPPDRMPVLFEPFQQASQGRSGHLGLGLYIVREIVRAHGGTIAARSTADGLTTFTIELPRVEAARTA